MGTEIIIVFILGWLLLGAVGSGLIMRTFYEDFGCVTRGDIILGSILASAGLVTFLIGGVIWLVHRHGRSVSDWCSKCVWSKE